MVAPLGFTAFRDGPADGVLAKTTFSMSVAPTQLLIGASLALVPDMIFSPLENSAVTLNFWYS